MLSWESLNPNFREMGNRPGWKPIKRLSVMVGVRSLEFSEPIKTLQPESKPDIDLKELNQKLELQTSELKSALELMQSEKMSALGKMVAGVAHEINNPINFIHGNLAHVQEYTHDLLRLLDAYQEQYPHPSQSLKTDLGDVNLSFLREDLQKIFSIYGHGV